MNKLLLLSLIQGLTPNNAKILSYKYNIPLSDYEISIFLPYIKRNANSLIKLNNPSKKIYEDLSNIISIDSISKLIFILQRLGFN